jgi:hypothetical protein
MFTSVTEQIPLSEIKVKSAKNKTPPNIYPLQHMPAFTTNEMNSSAVDQMLEREKQTNKTENWNKLDKTAKIQKLHAFAEKYGKEHGYPVKDVKNLKMFFVNCLEKNKLQKTKDLVYDKDTHEITSIPALHFNTATHNFTLKIMDAKRVSTLKSLTPKRISEKAREEETEEATA